MSWVYFIRAGKSGPIKIGVSSDPRKRLASLQTANHERLVLVGACFSGAEAYIHELQLHSAFARQRIGDSEWFRPSRTVVRLAESYGPAGCDRCQGVATSAPPLFPFEGPCFECLVREEVAA